jgi:hypothetical protein
MRCPVCKADNTQGPTCRRCKVDLSSLYALESSRGRLLDTARNLLSRGEWESAADFAGEAHTLRADDESARTLASALLMARDFAGAWELYAATTVDRSTPS